MLRDEEFGSDMLVFSLFNLNISQKSGVCLCGLYGKFCLSTYLELLFSQMVFLPCRIQQKTDCLLPFFVSLCVSIHLFPGSLSSTWLLLAGSFPSESFQGCSFFLPWMEYEEELHQRFHKRVLQWKPLNPCDLSWSWRLDHWTRSRLVSLKTIYAFKRFSLLYNRYVNSVAFFW